MLNDKHSPRNGTPNIQAAIAGKGPWCDYTDDAGYCRAADGKRTTDGLSKMNCGGGKSLWFCGHHWHDRERFRPATAEAFRRMQQMVADLANRTHYLKATCRMCGLELDGQASKCDCGATDLELSTVAIRRAPTQPIAEPGAEG